MTNKLYADGHGPRYEYDANGRLTKRTWARGVETFYAYDGWGNLTNTTYSDNTPTIALRYDALGRQVEAHDAAGVTTFIYDDYGVLTNETVIGAAGTNIIERYYDTFGRNAGYALNGIRQTTLGYDPATGRLATMRTAERRSGVHTASDENEFVWSYLPNSDLKSSLLYPNGLTATWTYDANSQLLQVRNATPSAIISQYDYTYDAAGRLIARAHSGTAFLQSDMINYAYNIKSELTNAVAVADATYAYAYDFDEIGNRRTSSECGVRSAEYAANELNQYTAISTDTSALFVSPCETFTPLFDADGNQTLVKTATGIWQVTYNGENRPILWTCGETNIVMSYDRMGRRVTKSAECGGQSAECCRFVYDGYLQIANHHSTSTPTPSTYTFFLWDPTEPVATRPLVWFNSALDTPHSALYYAHDGNKNVSEVIEDNGGIAAHYEYAPFGAVTAQSGESADANPWRFSSEFADGELGCDYYNYREYEPVAGRWMGMDPIDEYGDLNFYALCQNSTVLFFDIRGLYASNLPGVLQKSYCERAYNFALKHLHTQQERAAWERYTNHGWHGSDRDIHLSPEDVKNIAMSVNAVAEYIKSKRALCKAGNNFEIFTSIGGTAPAPWVLAIGGVSINVNASCKEGCFSYCLSIKDLYDFDVKGIPGFTSRSAKGEFNTWLVNITEVCLQCEWATFYHVGSFCGGDRQ